RARRAPPACDADGPAELLRGAKRLEAFDPELPRQPYLIAWGGAIVAGQEEVGLEICRAVQALPRSETSGALDVVLQAVTRLTLDGPAVAIPQLQAAARGAADLPVGAVIGWGRAAVCPGDAARGHEARR